MLELDNNKIHLFKKPACPQCNATERHLRKKLGEENYEAAVVEYDMSQQLEAMTYVRDTLGYAQAPVVVFRGQHWSGFHPDNTTNAAQAVLADLTA